MKLLTLLLAFASSGITSVTPPPAKPVLYANVCPTAGECAFVKTIANDCRQLSTPLGPTVKNITVWHPATCYFAATSNCSTYSNTLEPGISGGFLVKGGDSPGSASTAEDVTKIINGKVLSMICF